MVISRIVLALIVLIPSAPVGLPVYARPLAEIPNRAVPLGSPSQPSPAFPVGATPLGIAAGHFDGDGRLDFAVAVSTDSGGSVGVYLANPNGGFRLRSLTAVRGVPSRVIAGDFDADGFYDVAVAEIRGSSMHFLAGSGEGDLESKSEVALGGSLTALDSEDVDRADGLADVQAVVETEEGQITLVFASPEGALRASPTSVPNPPAGVRSQFFADDSVRIERLERLYGGLEGIGPIDPLIDAAAKANEDWSDIEVSAAVALPRGSGSDARLAVVLPGDPRPVLLAPKLQSTFSVTTTADSGAGSLRQAIADANASPGLDAITFNLTGTAPFVLQILTPLPAIADPATIDASTQSGYSGTPLVEARGPNSGTGLTITGGASTVRGLAITGFSKAIELSGSGGNVIAGNYFGLETDGATVRANSSTGVHVNNSADNAVGGTSPESRNVFGVCNTQILIGGPGSVRNAVKGNFVGLDKTGGAGVGNPGTGIVAGGGSSDTVIGGTEPGARNVVSANGGRGMQISDTQSSRVQGNYVGTDAGGTVDLGNDADGVYTIENPDILIGGTTPAARNVVSGNGESGVRVNALTALTATVQGNWIGLDATGTLDLGNGFHGLWIGNPGNSVIGGSVAGAGNVSSGNGGSGLVIVNADGNAIEGNRLGTNAAGTSAIGNDLYGIWLSGCTDLRIGGNAPGARNVVAGNGMDGIYVGYSTAVIEGNHIGTGVTGTEVFGNGQNGIYLQNVTRIGGPTPGAANVIAHNVLSGIAVYGDQLGLDIQRNAIHSNGSLGIDIGVNSESQPDGVDPNTPPGGDGINQNYPLLTAVLISGGSTTISGTLDSDPDRSIVIDFFHNATVDPSGHGEGEVYIGSTTITTDPTGHAVLNVTFPVALSVDRYVSAVATDSTQMSSEFSTCRRVGTVSDGPVITPAGSVTCRQGSQGSVQTIASVSDSDTPAGSLVVTVLSAPPGVTVATPIVSGDGVVSSFVTASCQAAAGNNVVSLMVSDGFLSDTRNLDVLVEANAAPTLGVYGDRTVGVGGSRTVFPSVFASDDGGLPTMSVSLSPLTFGGNVDITSGGVVTLWNLGPADVYTVTVTATDNCGAQAIRQFSLSVNVSVGPDTAGIYVPATGSWFLRNANSAGGADLVFGYGPTNLGWIPLRGDWDGNGTDTPGLYDPVNGFFFLKNTNGAGAADLVFGFGPPGLGWTPLVGDWNGDGIESVGLYNPATGFFFLRNQHTAGPAELAYGFGPGGLGWVPLVGDWDNNGPNTVGLYDPSTGNFFLRNAHSAGGADVVFGFGPTGLGWKPLASDWNGDGWDTVGLYSPSNGFFFLRNTNTPGAADLTFGYGPAGATPVAGDWDGQ